MDTASRFHFRHIAFATRDRELERNLGAAEVGRATALSGDGTPAGGDRTERHRKRLQDVAAQRRPRRR